MVCVMITAQRALDALGDRTRRRVFTRLRRRTCSAGELAKGMRVTRSAVSQHLQVLRSAGLVTVRADGTRRLYRVDRRGVAAVRRWLDGFGTRHSGRLRRPPSTRPGKDRDGQKKF